MMEAQPSSPFVVVEAKLALELLVVALDPPTHLREVHDLRDAGACGQVAKPELDGRSLGGRPFNEQPLERPLFAPPRFPLRCSHSQQCESRAHLALRPVSPPYGSPRRFGQLARQVAHRNVLADALL